MKRPAIFFDRDNTLIVSDGYLGDAASVQLIPGAAAAVARAKQLGYATVTFSNQSGVARGMFDEQAVRDVNRRLDELLRAQNADATIECHEFCPYHPEAPVERYRQDSALRKPKPGMIHSAAAKLDLDLSRSWVIGDAPRDIEAGHAAGLRTILFRDPAIAPSPAADAKSDVQPDFTVSTLQEAIAVIERAATPGSPSTGPAPRNASPGAAPAASDATKLQLAVEQILHEMRRRNEREVTEFSMPRLLANIVQVIVLAVLFFAYLNYQDSTMFQSLLMLAMTLQTMVAALLIMGRRRA
jgi:D-glycero-D-manno-heptose 1,7-bisphosphate phosphatase